jgi:hypothetical protein
MNEVTQEELERRFGIRSKPEVTVLHREKVFEVHKQFRALAGFVCRQTEVSREQALALTKLEEALVWTLTSIERDR